jgi:hypothetical protein
MSPATRTLPEPGAPGGPTTRTLGPLGHCP